MDPVLPRLKPLGLDGDLGPTGIFRDLRVPDGIALRVLDLRVSFRSL